MIIDSHTHYTNSAYRNPFRYLSYDKDGYALKEGDREQLFREMQEAGIPYSIEVGVGLQSCQDVLKLRRIILGGCFLPLGTIPPEPFMRNGQSGSNWIRWLGLRVLLPLAKSVWTIITSVKNSIG